MFRPPQPPGPARSPPATSCAVRSAGGAGYSRRSRRRPDPGGRLGGEVLYRVELELQGGVRCFDHRVIKAEPDRPIDWVMRRRVQAARMALAVYFLPSLLTMGAEDYAEHLAPHTAATIASAP
jgi:hypothetical protein